MSAQSRILRAAKAALDVLVLSGAFGLAFMIRFEGSLPGDMAAAMIAALPWILGVKLLAFALFRVRRLTWRFIGLVEAQRIFTGLALASTVLVCWRLAEPTVLQAYVPRYFQVPLAVLWIDLPLSFLGILGLRVVFRAWIERCQRARDRSSRPPRIPTLLIGTGRASVLVAKELTAGNSAGIRAVGFIDHNPDHRGQVIHGLPILGTLDELGSIVRASGARQALIAMENTSGKVLRRIVHACEGCGVTTQVFPEFREMVEGKVNLSSIRDVAIEDLLRREPVTLDMDAISEVVRERTVLITGSGGSIGSELCRLVCGFQPEVLVLVEHAENNLFYIQRELSQAFPHIEINAYLADVCDVVRMKDIIACHQPAVIFHAAAHKHVPLMESNAGEAIKNNVAGTRILADLADAYGVGEFVMISTDKAVNPTSVMGVSKRVAEIYLQALSQRSATRFVAVRFGNVLGSTGSVIPIFKEQIANGGPVTVTHPDMKRYFMTIPEACQLVLQAASMGGGGEIFILDMGQPIRIVDLARDLILLSGLQPGKDIEIEFSGIRPGEKLFEELALSEENAAKTRHPRIFIGRLKAHDWLKINRQIDELCELANCPDAGSIHAKFKEIVPEYCFGKPARAAQPIYSCAAAAHVNGTATHVNGTAAHGNGTAARNGSALENGSKNGSKEVTIVSLQEPA
jgi:FlaA1/EpsC-like NDP-sugar epimerase